MKAYKVSCDDDDHGATVTFAESGKTADRYANSDRCDCEFIRKTVHRAPAFDKYAPGPVTTKDYLAEGWYWNCGSCERQVFGDHHGLIVTDDGYVYCDEKCLREALESHRSLGPNAHESILACVRAMESYLARRA